ncbi:MAG: hypothetical protein JXQ73_09240 [Phycisphaerae bacterium]|nr:hypothetical protein [Phycisphaerae bacterium]
MMHLDWPQVICLTTVTTLILGGSLMAEPPATPSTFVATATPLYVNTPAGLKRLASVRITGPAAKTDGRLRLTLGDQTDEHRIVGNPSGDQALQATFPPVDKPYIARVEFISQAGTLAATMPVAPAKQWTIYVAPTVHTDIGYTHHQSEIPAIHNANTDLAVKLCRAYPGFRFRLECSWSAQMYERDRGPTRMAELMDLARRRRIGVEANYVNMLTGLCSAEELVRWLYPTASLVRRFGIPFETATQDDTPSYVWSVPTVLRSAGIRYLTVGVNNNQTRAPILRGGLDKRSPFWWQGPDGAKVLTWYAGRYVQAGELGLVDSLEAAEKKLLAWLTEWDRREDYPYDAILMHGAYGDNRPIGEGLAQTVTAWNAKYAFPKIVMTGFGEFFSHIETRFADKIPTIRGCGGAYWEDGAASSARQTAINRRNHHRIVTAETLHAAASLLDAKHAYPRDRITKTWENILLYDEHTWGARRWSRSPEHEEVKKQWATKAAFATDAERDTASLLDQGLSLLADRIAGKNEGILVVNPISWTRTDAICLRLPHGAHLTFGKDVTAPMQVLSTGPREDDVCVLVKDIPSLGYRRYDLATGGAPAASSSIPDAAPTCLENRFYRVTLDKRSGAIAAILDKQTHAEIVDATSPYKLGEVIYAAGGAGTTAIEWNKRLPPARFNLSRPNGATWRLVSKGDLLTKAVSSTKTKMLPEIALEVTLYEHVKRIDLAVHLDKTLTYDMEAVYIAFPLAAKRPEFCLDVGGAWVRPDKDMLPGGCLDWFSVQDCVTLATGETSVNLATVDTPLISLCDINIGKWLQKLDVTNGTVLAYAMNNYWPTNYKPGQGGKFTFRYSIASDKAMSKTQALHHGHDAARPLIAARVPPPSKPSLPSTGSLCGVSAPNVILTAMKQAEDGNGLILRFNEVAGTPTRCDVALDALPAPKSASRCDAIERDLSPASVQQGKLSFDVKPFGIETFRLRF